ncbi:MAG TPA: hypothetical protein GXX30_01225 [Firmicutes bacterium]|nr:hypothetical protein [Candidatus Fermentithermobacillaceae bacterium]
MWIFWALVSFAVLAWLGYAWLATLSTKYEHTVESRVVLAFIWILALAAAWRISVQVAPGWSVAPRVIVASAVGFGLFTIFSFAAVSLWCSLLTREFDEKIAALEEEEAALQRRLDILRWESLRGGGVELSPAKVDMEEAEARKTTEEARDLREILEKWQQSGGAARVRSLKVLEWKEEISRAANAEIVQEIEALEREIRGEEDEIKIDQAKAKLALLKLELLERVGASSPVSLEREKVGSGSQKGSGKSETMVEADVRRRLQEIHRELQAAETGKREFLRGRIRLTWRARS